MQARTEPAQLTTFSLSQACLRVPKAKRIPHYIETEQSWFLLVQAECTYQKSERNHHTETCWIEFRAQEQQLLSSSRSWSCSTSLQNQKLSIHFSFWKFAARLGRKNKRINTLSKKKNKKESHKKKISKERELLRPREKNSARECARIALDRMQRVRDWSSRLLRWGGEEDAAGWWY